MKNVSFIPAQMDGFASTSTEAARETPLRLVLQDAGVLIQNIRYLPWIILPFKTSDSSAELYMSLSHAKDNLIQCGLFFVEAILLLLAVPAALVLPGSITILAAYLCWLVIHAICLPLQGPRVVHSEMDGGAVMASKKHEGERWIFINGCMTGHLGLQANCDRLAKIFGRPVVGIHNQTYGLIADLLECILQRCLSYHTKDCRITYEYVKACLVDPSVTKVVLVAHSQGGIIASTVLDKLFGELPPATIGKLEVYTFGSAASHFNNPTLHPPSASSTSEARLEALTRCIPHIEHYCNELDMITRWGVLYNVTQILDNRYCGKVFVRMGASGHMFNQHYLDPMFPLDKTRANEFLDHVVDVDEKTASRRESVSAQQTGIMRRESSLENFEFGDGRVMPIGGAGSRTGKLGADSAGVGSGINFVESSGLEAAQARGKTVRELSRLWRYVGGGSPNRVQIGSLDRVVNGMTRVK